MDTLTKRIEIRISKEGDRGISQAAALLHQNKTEFIRQASLAKAEEVLKEHSAVRTLMGADQFDGLYGALDVPDEAPELEKITHRQKRFLQS